MSIRTLKILDFTADMTSRNVVEDLWTVDSLLEVKARIQFA